MPRSVDADDDPAVDGAETFTHALLLASAICDPDDRRTGPAG
jgi:hypothetical protein